MWQLWHGKLYKTIFICSGVALLIGCCFYPFSPSFFRTFFPAFFEQVAESECILKKNRCMQWDFYGIDVDSNGYCYIAFDTSIFVYDNKGDYLYRYQKPIFGSFYDFSIDDDTLCFWFARSNMYNYSFSGYYLGDRPFEYEEKPQYHNFIEQRKCIKNDILKYQYHSVFGFWWVTDGNKQIFTHIPISMYLVKTSVVVFVACMVVTINKGYKAFLRLLGK